ncbi:MAG TPA: ATP-dependent zinc metalloprotease FtsH [Candidatus Syntrophosphaera sp.]|jgi:cell division protease FtsH|nr:ATP-dependent zinc metalloprotease FtsH [Candidatus Syntrophosphaera sp.]HPW38441.1 ATP-dependent zinc metalloprotease FtsH [Candidatus Syntrophosphaera sp.]HPX67346.1 ATP-dependent zinc metalloprotease FtsH [Candidatus Syntrophosphaera sp.]HQC46743.1 ATP-dependent zinc metalloprotease FtsH [Candidatus Syntrophosphaera sp.]
MKHTVIIIALLALNLTLSAADSLSFPAQRARDVAQSNQVAQQFSDLLLWFVIALVAITVISAVRIFLLKRKKPGESDSYKQPQTPPRTPRDLQPDQQLRQPARAPVSWTFVIVILALVALMVFSWFSGQEHIGEANYSQFAAALEKQQVKSVTFTEQDIVYQTREGKKFHTLLPPVDDPSLIEQLRAQNVVVITKKPPRWTGILSYLIPFVLLIGFWWFLMRGMNNQNARAFSFGKSRARMHEGSRSNITFKDVAGVDEAKEELQEIVEFLKDPKKFQRLGGRIPRGVLLMGRPGTGKTLLAKAVSGEAGVPFYSISGSDFVEMFVGVGAARVRDLFEQAKKNAPCITFIDEIDAVGRHRGTGLGGGHDEREQTLNQLLVEMDGFEPNEAVIIIAATNRPDILDPALLRPGRFDRQVTVDLPDIKGRTEILKVHSAKVPLAEDVHLELIARGTPGFSGADLANIVNEAALIAARQNKQKINMSDFEEAKDKLTLGKEKKSRVIPDEDKKLTSIHEIGHVLTSIFQDKTEPVHKVSIIPRGFTAGATHFLQTDKTGYSRGYLEQLMTKILGGRAAEEIVFGELTTGAGNDLDRVTEIAKKMVCSWGMSEAFGPMTIGKEQSEVYLGKELIGRDVHSNETAHLVDSEIRGFITRAYDKALDILKKRRDLLEKLAAELFEKETLGTDEIFEFVLANIDDADREQVLAKYEKARELRFEHNKKPAQEGQA